MFETNEKQRLKVYSLTKENLKIHNELINNSNSNSNSNPNPKPNYNHYEIKPETKTFYYYFCCCRYFFN